jgi:hypothetical protein
MAVKKVKLKDQYAAVDITLPDGSKLPTKRSRGNKKNIVCDSSQLYHTVRMSFGADDGKMKPVEIDVPITRSGSLMACYGLANAVRIAAERYVQATIDNIEKTGQLPNSQELKDMIAVVKSVQSVMMDTWDKVATGENGKKDTGFGVHAPVLNQFFNVQALVSTDGGKVPSMPDVLGAIAELEVVGKKAIKCVEECKPTTVKPDKKEQIKREQIEQAKKLSTTERLFDTTGKKVIKVDLGNLNEEFINGSTSHI